jgi:hypothetical protein
MTRGEPYAVETIGGVVWYSVTRTYRTSAAGYLLRRLVVRAFTGYRWPS